MPRYDIYGLIDPLNNEMFYIGQTIFVPRYRLLNHIAASKNFNSPVYIRIKQIISNGVRPKIVTLKRFNSELCTLTDNNHGLFFEKIYIQEFSSLGTLVNIHQNPLYDKVTKSFLPPKDKKQLKFKNGIYYVESEVITNMYQEPYNPFKNHRFLAKLYGNNEIK